MAELEALRRTPRNAQGGAATIDPRPVTSKGYRTIVIDFKAEGGDGRKSNGVRF